MPSGKPRRPASRTWREIVAVLAVLATAATAGPAAAASHHRRKPPPPVVAVGQPAPGSLTSVTSVACGDPMHCWAVGQSTAGAAIDATHDGGKSWQRQVPPAGVTLLTGVSCPARLSCLAVGTAGATGVAVATDDGGRIWTQGQNPQGTLALTAVDCTAKDRCLALATNGTTWWVELSTDLGRSWTQEGDLPAGMVPAQLTCPTPSRCVAVGSTPTAPGSAIGAVAVSADGGETWELASLPGGVGILRDVVCVASSCLAAGTPSTATTGFVAASGQLLTSANAGTSWAILTDSLPDDAYGVACPEAKVCLVVGTDWVGKDPARPTAAIRATLNGGRSWRPARLRYVPVGMSAVACPVPDHCLAAGGNVLVQVALPVRPSPSRPRRAGIPGAH
jgi:photosystem II stability/assembly factor-like uncharacterized protein